MLPGPKHDVLSDGIRDGIDRTRRFRRPAVGMEADAAELVVEARLHEGPRGGVEGLAGRVQHGVHN
jgi:hypothetical protein